MDGQYHKRCLQRTLNRLKIEMLKIDRGFVAFSSVSLCHSINVTFDGLLRKCLVWWKVNGCLLKTKKEQILLGYCRNK